MENHSFEIGKKYWTDGLNMRCRPVRVRVTLVRFVSDHERYDCVTESGGIKVFGNLSDLSVSR